jgi:sialic acid synthase SpsE
MGAVVIEKHFTIDRSLPGPDHKASLEPAELAQLVRQVRLAELMLGSSEKAPAPTELAVREVVRRSVFTRRAIPAGGRVGMDDLVLLRPGTGIAPREIPQLVGRTARTLIPPGQMLSWEMLQE